jgi:CheY-like chemotaxis protein
MGEVDLVQRVLRSPGTPTPVIVVMEKPVVLIVEKNAVVRSAIAKRLRAAGFEVIEAANSAEAEQVLKSTVVDALLSDIPKPAE